MNGRVTYGFVNEGAIPCPNGQKLSYGDVVRLDAEADITFAAWRTREIAKQKGLSLEAAAEFLGPGNIQVPRFQSQILDLTRGRGVLGQRIVATEATGHPSRYFEQRAILAGGFTDPRAITTQPGTPPRTERSLALKAVAGAINFGMFDIEIGRQQGQYTNLTAKDLNDLVKGMLRTSDKAIWRGSDTSLESPTTEEYVGGDKQINRTFLVGSSASAVDAVKTEVASLMSSEDYEVRPSGIYGHPLTIDLIEQEERLNHRQMPAMEVTNRDNDVIAGVKVGGISTAAGLLPLVTDWSMPAPRDSLTEAGKKEYPIAILSEELIEYHYVTVAEPRLYVLGLQSNLATQYVGVMFGATVFKGKADPVNTPELAGNRITYAHSFGWIIR